MKKEALELVRRIFHSLKYDIPHNDLEDIFIGAKTQAKMFCDLMSEEHKERKEKYDLLKSEIEKITFNNVYNG